MATSQRVFNFGAGPAVLPDAVLLEAQKDLLNYKNSGRSVMELSHRSPLFEDIIQTAENHLRTLLNIPTNYKVLFLQGGGTGQFAAIPMNLLGNKEKADYFVTGVWSQKAFEEAKKYCKPNIVCSGEKTKFTSIPQETEWKFDPESSFIYYCDNETVNGVEFPEIPKVPSTIPLVCDMSSNFLSKKVDVSKYGLIYAGAQKNSGIAGVTVVIVREDLLQIGAKSYTPTVFNYKLFSDNKSLYNTPPTFSIYIAGLVYKWLIDFGGVEAMAQQKHKQSQQIYELVEASQFFRCPVEKGFRSRINIPIRIKEEKLESVFVKEATEKGMVELAGHRIVGGLRVSLYNAMSDEGVKALCTFMKDFQAKHSM